MKKSISVMTAVVTAMALCSYPFMSLNVNAEDIVSFSVTCPDAIYVDDNFTMTIICNSNTEFESLQFELNYDSEFFIFEDKEDKDDVSSDKGNPRDYSIENNGNRVVYSLIPDNVKYHNMNVPISFKAIAEGNSNFSVTVTEMKQDNENDVPIIGNPVVTKPVVVLPKDTKPNTGTTTTVDSANPNTGTTTTVDSANPNDGTTTTVNSANLNNGTTTTVNSANPNNGTTTTVNSANPNDGTTITVDLANPNDGTITIKPIDSSVKISTTKTSDSKTITTETGNKSTPDTGDRFPFISIGLVLVGSAVLAFKTRRSNKK